MASGGKSEAKTEPGEGEATLLVSEFPPPPFYHNVSNLPPPPIPEAALINGTKRAAEAAARARLLAEQGDTTDTILGGADKVDETGDVVAVFGEIVEDPYLVQPPDSCEDPKVIKESITELNLTVLQNFKTLVDDLVHRPLDNKKTRDELSKNIVQMVEQVNKFREHQAREILIELLEKQLQERKKLIVELQEDIGTADELLNAMETE